MWKSQGMKVINNLAGFSTANQGVFEIDKLLI
jgi:hypothetical protein